MKKTLLTLMIWGIAAKVFAFDISWETISGSRSSDSFAWDYSYDIGYFNNTLMIDLDIKLEGAVVNALLLDKWENGIEEIWSTNRFEVPISFNIDWVSSNYDQIVTIHGGDAAVFNMSNWNEVGANGWGEAFQEEIAAHEAGHMFGLWDEYSEGAVDPVTGLINTGGLMDTLNGSTLNPYYNEMLNWYDNLAPIPIPAASWLFGSGLFGLLGIKKAKKRPVVIV